MEYQAPESCEKALRAMALETLLDGCLIEDLNADVADVAHARAGDAAAKDVAARIAREERAHAELGWDILSFCLREGGAPLERAVREHLSLLPERGPLPYDADLGRLVAEADPAQLVRHGRVPAPQWPALFDKRRRLTLERAERLLSGSGKAAPTAA